MPRSKYKSKKIAYAGIQFASQAEFRRYRELEILQTAGEIQNLRRAQTFQFVIADKKICKYTPDFQYDSDGQSVVEEVKSGTSGKEQAYVIRKKLFLALFPELIFKEILR